MAKDDQRPSRRLSVPLVLVGALVVIGIGIALSNSGDTPNSGGLEEAMCADLSDGFSIFQMHSQAVDHYRGSGRSGDAAQLAAAKLEDRATRVHCPEFRDEFEATLTYEQWIAPSE